MALLTALAALAGIVLGFLAGFAAGRRISARPTWVYWLLNLAALAIGLAVDVAGLLIGSVPVAIFGLALFAGGISGLKYGYGRTLGLRQVVDTVLGVPPSAQADSGPHVPPSRRDIPHDEPGFLSSPLGRDRDTDGDQAPR
jgi:hypothetical protein